MRGAQPPIEILAEQGLEEPMSNHPGRSPRPALTVAGIAALTVFAVWACLVYHSERPDPLHQWRAVRQLEHVAFALEAHRQMFGKYPITLEEVTFVPGWMESGYRSPQLHSDPWDTPLLYSSQRDERGYLLASCGGDGICSERWSYGWNPGDSNQDIVIQSGRWLRRPDPALAAATSVQIFPDVDAESRLNLEIRVKSREETPLGATVAGWTLGRARWLHPAGKATKRLLVQEVAGNELRSPSQLRAVAELTPQPPSRACVIMLVRHNQYTEGDYTDNVASWCEAALEGP